MVHICSLRNSNSEFKSLPAILFFYLGNVPYSSLTYACYRRAKLDLTALHTLRQKEKNSDKHQFHNINL